MNKIIKILLVSTSLAPILLTYWFIEQVKNYDVSVSFLSNIKSNFFVGIGFLISTVILVLICLIIIKLAKNNLEVLPIVIDEIKTADNESLVFIIIYLLPLANGVTNNFSIPILVFIAVLFL